MKITFRILCASLTLLLTVLFISGCDEISQDDVLSVLEGINDMLEETDSSSVSVAPENADDSTDTAPADQTAVGSDVIAYGEYYYDIENVVLYLDTYGELPENYITKQEAEELGWEGGSVEKYQDGAAIGGDRFGNYEKLLPDSTWVECDIDTENENNRGAKRLVFSLEDGLYYYTDDHYETFTEVYVTEDGQVEYK